MRTNHPAVLNLILDGSGSLAYVSRTADGIPVIPTVDLGNGIIPVPSPVTVFTLADKFERGYIRSFNGAFQRELGHGAFRPKPPTSARARSISWGSVN